MTVDELDERLERIERALDEVMESMIILANAIDELEPGATRDSLEAQHQRFKRRDA